MQTLHTVDYFISPPLSIQGMAQPDFYIKA